MKRERGAALLAAMVTVTLVATLAATALWRQTQLSAMEAAERQRQQAAWVLAGALDWSRLILRSDADTAVDHLGEPWSVLLQETRLSSFLAADKSTAAAEDLARQPDVFLSGRIQDAQSLLNFRNLLLQGKVVPAAELSFRRLFQLLGLPQSELSSLIAQWTLADTVSTTEAGTNSLPQPLPPQRWPDLLRLGLSPATLARLQAHATLLPSPTRQSPTPTTLNLNTASAEAIAALLDLPLGEARKLVRARALQPFADLPAAERAAQVAAGRFPANAAGVSSHFFLVRGRLRLDTLTLQEESLVSRQNRRVVILWRERGVLPDSPPSAPEPSSLQ